MLARREYSRAELAQRLLRKGIARDDIERALDELAAAGYLSDARYANAVVAQRSGRYGKRADRLRIAGEGHCRTRGARRDGAAGCDR
jgi:regulatory protein